MQGIIGYSAYVPFHRLRRDLIHQFLGRGATQGTRSVASYDEDTTTMAVEAAHNLLRDLGEWTPRRLWFSTTQPAYLDKTNSTVVHGALGLSESVLAADFMGSVHSGISAFLAAADSSAPTIVALSDLRSGLPGGADESAGGDAAAAFAIDSGTTLVPVIAEIIGEGHITSEALERWRDPAETTSRVWEERFGEEVLAPAASSAFEESLKSAGIDHSDISHLIVAGLNARARRSFVSMSHVDRNHVVNDRTDTLGNSGSALPGVLLCEVLDTAGPDDLIAVVVLGDGATSLVLKTTDALPRRRSSQTVSGQLSSTSERLDYGTYLQWRHFLLTEPPRRPDPQSVAAPPAYRNARFKLAFVGVTCDDCGALHLPPKSRCSACGSTHVSDRSMANEPASLSHLIVDHLAQTPSPPLVAGAIDFERGGRYRCELTDFDLDTLAVGIPVELTFRRVATTAGVHNYFWKARPARRSRTQGST